ncbi:unnamed protein product [Amoebophrya sp. A25]|nr:unnamed protein product [Amoebophrya sp. A25]|eukprot:GSA25T00025881001.1
MNTSPNNYNMRGSSGEQQAADQSRATSSVAERLGNLYLHDRAGEADYDGRGERSSHRAGPDFSTSSGSARQSNADDDDGDNNSIAILEQVSETIYMSYRKARKGFKKWERSMPNYGPQAEQVLESTGMLARKAWNEWFSYGGVGGEETRVGSSFTRRIKLTRNEEHGDPDQAAEISATTSDEECAVEDGDAGGREDKLNQKQNHDMLILAGSNTSSCSPAKVATSPASKKKTPVNTTTRYYNNAEPSNIPSSPFFSSKGHTLKEAMSPVQLQYEHDIDRAGFFDPLPMKMENFRGFEVPVVVASGSSNIEVVPGSPTAFPFSRNEGRGAAVASALTSEVKIEGTTLQHDPRRNDPPAHQVEDEKIQEDENASSAFSRSSKGSSSLEDDTSLSPPPGEEQADRLQQKVSSPRFQQEVRPSIFTPRSLLGQHSPLPTHRSLHGQLPEDKATPRSYQAKFTPRSYQASPRLIANSVFLEDERGETKRTEYFQIGSSESGQGDDTGS